MKQPCSWHLYNNLTRQQMPDVSEESLKLVVASWRQDDLQFWFAWQPGWENWRSVKEVGEIMALRVVAAPPPPPPSAMTPPPPPPPMAHDSLNSTPVQTTPPSSLGELLVNEVQPTMPPAQSHQQPQQMPAQTQIPASQPAETPAQGAPVTAENKRRHKRYDLRLRVILTNGQSTFRTFTRNISLGGVFLEHPVPANIVNTKCEIYIANMDNSSHIKFETKVITNTPDGPKHFSFSEMDTMFQDELAKWLAKLESAQVKAS